MDIYESIAAVASLLSVYLTAKENKWCWYIGIIGIAFYMIVFYQNGLYGNFYLQFVFIIQSILGIVNWDKHKADLKPTWLKNWKLIFGIFMISATTVVMLLDANYDRIPTTDGITTTLSVFGMFLLAYKKIDAWLYWLAANLIYVFMFYQSGLLISTITYSIFSVLSIIGLFKWIKSSRAV